MTEPLPLRIGDRIAGRYVVERVLGQGGMGVVVAARHVELDQLFAIKLLLPGATADAAATERLLREARAAARLTSPHVARVSDVGRTERGEPYLVMEHLVGCDLAALLAERGPLPAAEAARHVLEACDAIAEAHAAGIVHRDLKPANLFLARRPDGSATVKVLDFGIAKESAGLGSASITATGAVFGSPLYMAPEQVRAARLATPVSDVWALGITLYELVTCSSPFEAESVTELIAAILADVPIPPSARRSDVPPDLEAVILRCLARDPAHRYGSAAELAQALEPIARAHGGAAARTALASGSVATAPAAASPRRVDLVAEHASQTAAPTSSSIGRDRRRGAASLALAAGGVLLFAGLGAIAVLRPGEPAPPSVTASAIAEPTTVAPDAARPSAAPIVSAERAAPPPDSATPADAPETPVASAAAVAPSAGAATPPGVSPTTSATAGRPPRPRPPPRPPATPPPATTGWGGLL